LKLRRIDSCKNLFLNLSYYKCLINNPAKVQLLCGSVKKPPTAGRFSSTTHIAHGEISSCGQKFHRFFRNFRVG
ncbi:MAG: hypothetical protein ACTSUK_11210, partial [Promethearchaeota archaeon]